MSSSDKQCATNYSLEKELADLNAKYLELQGQYVQSEARNKRTELICQQMEQLEVSALTCVICEETYPSLSLLRLLPCAHIFCGPCLSKWIKQAQDNHSDSFECPLCRRQHLVPKIAIEQEWPHPHFLSNFLKCIHMNSCSLCDQASMQETACWICSECQETYCDSCKAQHDSLKTDHDVNLLSDVYSTPSDEQLYCKEHKSKQVEVFCKDCAVMTCASCAVNQHKSHNFVEISDAERELREIIKSKLFEVSEAEIQVNNYIAKIQEASMVAKEKTANILIEIDRRTEDIINEVKLCQNNLHLKVKYEEKVFDDSINALQVQANAHLQYLRNYKKKFSAVYDSGKIIKPMTDITIKGPELKSFHTCDQRSLTFAMKYHVGNETCDLRKLLGDIITYKPDEEGIKPNFETISASIATQTDLTMSGHPESEIQTGPANVKQTLSTGDSGNLLDRMQNIPLMKAINFQKLSTITISTGQPYILTGVNNQEIIVSLMHPPGLALNPSYSHSFEKYDLDGNALNKSFGTYEGNFFDVACRGNHVYISDGKTGNIRIFEKESCSLVETIIVGTKGQNSISITDDFLYITSCEEHSVYRLDLTNVKYSKYIFANDQMWSWFKTPTYVASGGNTVAISCSELHLVHVFNSDGSLRFTYGGKPGFGYGELSFPGHVCIDRKGNILISEGNNNRISILSPFGCLLDTIPSSDCYFNRSSPIALDFYGRFWFVTHPKDGYMLNIIQF